MLMEVSQSCWRGRLLASARSTLSTNIDDQVNSRRGNKIAYSDSLISESHPVWSRGAKQTSCPGTKPLLIFDRRSQPLQMAVLQYLQTVSSMMSSMMSNRLHTVFTARNVVPVRWCQAFQLKLNISIFNLFSNFRLTFFKFCSTLQQPHAVEPADACAGLTVQARVTGRVGWFCGFWAHFR